MKTNNFINLLSATTIAFSVMIASPSFAEDDPFAGITPLTAEEKAANMASATLAGYATMVDLDAPDLPKDNSTSAGAIPQNTTAPTGAPQDTTSAAGASAAPGPDATAGTDSAFSGHASQSSYDQFVDKVNAFLEVPGNSGNIAAMNEFCYESIKDAAEKQKFNGGQTSVGGDPIPGGWQDDPAFVARVNLLLANVITSHATAMENFRSQQTTHTADLKSANDSLDQQNFLARLKNLNVMEHFPKINAADLKNNNTPVSDILAEKLTLSLGSEAGDIGIKINQDLNSPDQKLQDSTFSDLNERMYKLHKPLVDAAAARLRGFSTN